MKNELRTPIWIVLMVFTLTLVTFTFVFSIIRYVEEIGIYNEYGRDYYLFNSFYTLISEIIIFPFFMVVITIFSKKYPILLVPLGLIVGEIAIVELFVFIQGLLSQTTDWYVVIRLLLGLGSLVLSLIGFIKTKPFSREKKENKAIDEKINDDYFEEISNGSVKRSSKKISLDDIFKAKELFDAGAITQEEFTEIKRRAID